MEVTATFALAGMRGAGSSTDGGRTWAVLTLPEGVTLVEASHQDPKRLYAAALVGRRASIWASGDGGRTWVRP